MPATSRQRSAAVDRWNFLVFVEELNEVNKKRTVNQGTKPERWANTLRPAYNTPQKPATELARAAAKYKLAAQRLAKQ